MAALHSEHYTQILLYIHTTGVRHYFASCVLVIIIIITGPSVNTGGLAGGIVSGTVLLILLIVVITVTVIVCGISRRRKLNAKLGDAASVRYVIL